MAVKAARGLEQADHAAPSVNRSQRKKLLRLYVSKTYSKGIDRNLRGVGGAAPFNKESLQGRAALLFL